MLTPRRMWIGFCESGRICPHQNFSLEVIESPVGSMFQDLPNPCTDGIHTYAQYVNSAWVKTEREPEDVERWQKYIETKDKQYLDQHRILMLTSKDGNFLPAKE